MVTKLYSHEDALCKTAWNRPKTNIPILCVENIMKTNTRPPINFYHTYTRLPFPEKTIRKRIAPIIRDFPALQTMSVDVILCSDYRIKKLNTKYRKKEKPTDVLSFVFNDSDFLGEIYLSLQRTAIQARRFDSSYEDELHRLLTHGLLHLLGYDHIKKSDRGIMESKEEKYRLAYAKRVKI